MLNLRKDNAGFTLVEIIVSLTLIGIIASFTLFFTISGVEGYIFSLQNTALSRKANLAMARIVKEFNSEMKEIELATSGSVKYVYQYNPRYYRYLALVGTGARKEVKLVAGDNSLSAPDSATPEILIDQVKSFELEFKKCDDSAWIVGDDRDDLCKIGITLELFISPGEDETISFETTVNPSSPHYIIGSSDFIKPAVKYPTLVIPAKAGHTVKHSAIQRNDWMPDQARHDGLRLLSRRFNNRFTGKIYAANS